MIVRRFLCLSLVVLGIAGCGRREGQAERLVLEGQMQQGGLVVGTVSPDALVALQGREVPVFDDGRFLIGFARDAGPQADLMVRWPSGKLTTRTLDVAQRRYAVQHIDGIDPALIDPPASEVPRINRERRETRAARSADTNYPFFDDGWVWPVKGTITGVYGSDRIYNGRRGQPHWGIDLAAPEGTAIRAPTTGVVRLVQPNNYFAGGLVIVDHGYGLTSSFLHMLTITVAPGQLVQRGQIIGSVGSTGRSTGPHLDWRLNLGPDLRLDVALLPLPARE